jgi:hypothetical protein
MTIALSVGAVTATSAVLNIGTPGAEGTIDVQLSTRADFSWCVCPIYSFPLGSTVTLEQINQATSYYARARTRPSVGDEEAWSNIAGFRTPLVADRATAPQAIMIDPVMLVVPEPILSWLPDRENAGYPARNLARDAPAAWECVMYEVTPGNFAVGLEFSTAGAPVDTLALLNTNLPEGAGIDVRAGADQDNVRSGSPTFVYGLVSFRASANLPGRNGYHGLIRFPGPVAQPYWRIGIYGITPSHLLHVEHLVIGLNRKSRNHALDKRESGSNLGSLERTRSGNPDRQDGARMREVEFDIAFMTEAQYETVYADLIYRQNEPVLVVPNTRQGGFLHDRILYGDLTGGQTSQPTSPHYTRGFKINSLI